MNLILNEKEFEIQIKKVVSSKTKVDFIKAIENLKNDPIIDESIEILAKQDYDVKDEAGKVNLGDMLKFSKLQKRFSADIQEHNDKVFIDCFKAIIDVKQLTTEQKEAISTANNSEFWQDQDIIGITREVNSFCQLLKQ